MNIGEDVQKIISENKAIIAEMERLNKILIRTKIELDMLKIMEGRALGEGFKSYALSAIDPTGREYISMAHLLFNQTNKQELIELMRKQALKNWNDAYTKLEETKKKLAK